MFYVDVLSQLKLSPYNDEFLSWITCVILNLYSYGFVLWQTCCSYHYSNQNNYVIFFSELREIISPTTIPMHISTSMYVFVDVLTGLVTGY